MLFHNRKLCRNSGFSLVELTIVLAVIGFIVMGVMTTTGEFRSASKVEESHSITANLKEKLLTFALVNGYLPCPDTNTPPDGEEDRVGEVCVGTKGVVPYLNLGLTVEEVQDKWGNFVSYAVNQDVTNATLICDANSSASYFCNANTNFAAFTFRTPPVVGNKGEGNYTVCNKNATSCGGATPNENLLSDSASVVLVAYNEDGASVLANCTGTAWMDANRENCDKDVFYHRAEMTSEENNFFDDTISMISGNEIKALLLSPVTWNKTVGAGGGLPPTYQGYTLDAEDLVENGGRYQVKDDSNATATENTDVIVVNKNVTTALDLGRGDDQITIGNDLSSELVYDNVTGSVIDIGTQAQLNTGEGDDTVYIVGEANSDVYLAKGNDVFILGTNLTQFLSAGEGDDKVWIQGNVKSSASFTLASGDDVVWLGKAENNDEASSGGEIQASIDGGDGHDVLVLENMTKSEWELNTNLQAEIKNFEVVFFRADESKNREYIAPL
ncbi:hypothetical protein MNBD_GAMMA03-1341 [hydrothermal vent metagenome]|uniref:Prepilin-type N-terminal cleavage/methylation domain-containing protein n=1 Tax=hydrothermal vent metagenome TaxID=652676 RepID=A0A3B0VX17_9ZZZZ